nr:Ycf37 [Porphyropsis coccinea]
MSPILGTTYLGILLFFLLLFSYLISKSIIKNIQEENLFNTIAISNKLNSENTILHLELAYLYMYKGIIDAGIYEATNLLCNEKYNTQEISKLHALIGKGYEDISQNLDAKLEYTKAIELAQDNLFAIKRLAIINKKKS